jgi:Na+/H+-dicarboxylate symporter
MYMTFASIFIAQIYGIEMTLGQQITMLLGIDAYFKRIAGVPRASLVIIGNVFHVRNSAGRNCPSCQSTISAIWEEV